MAIIKNKPLPTKIPRTVFTQFRQGFQNIAIKATKRAFQSLNFVTGSLGWRLDSEGNFEASSGIFRGAVKVGSLEYSKFTVQSSFESLDGWITESTGQFNSLGYVEISTTSTINNIQGITAPADDQFTLTPDVTKNPIFETVIYVSGAGSFDARIGMGELDSDNGVGFKLTNSVLSALWFDDSNVEHLTTISGITTTDLNRYRIEINNGTDIRWYVNEVLEYTLDVTSIVVNVAQGNMIKFWIKTLASSVARIGAYRVLYQQNY